MNKAIQGCQYKRKFAIKAKQNVDLIQAVDVKGNCFGRNIIFFFKILITPWKPPLPRVMENGQNMNLFAKTKCGILLSGDSKVVEIFFFLQICSEITENAKLIWTIFPEKGYN